MSCCEDNGTCILDRPSDGKTGTFLLFGNPNVGKSVIFSKLTGKDVQTANYTGTTVSFTRGTMQLFSDEAELIDVPGIYSLSVESVAEQVAVDFLERGADAIIFVLDATNIEQSLHLAYDLMKGDLPLIFVLNLTDVAERKGILIDVEALEEELGQRVIPTVAIRNIGLKRVMAEIRTHLHATEPMPLPKRDVRPIEDVVARVETFEEKEPTLLDKIGDWSMAPKTGVPIAFLVMLVSFALVVGGGKALRSVLLLPLVNDVWTPLMEWLVGLFLADGTLKQMLVGEYGVLIKGVEWPFALILPYVFFFYIILSILEDSGYMPRLGALVDGILRRMGIQGSNIVPFMMGYGCAVPAIIGTRTSTSMKERLIVATVVSVAIPCASQTGAFVALLGDQSLALLIGIFLISMVFAFVAGVIVDKTLPGDQTPLLMEIPNLLVPERSTVVKKVKNRTKSFMVEAELPMLAGIAIAAVIVETGLMDSVAVWMEPLIETWLGLPKEASLALLLGFIRRELAVLPLLDLGLSTSQLFVGSIVALLYLPCLSVFGVLVKEFGVKIASTISVTTIVLALLIGGLVNQLIQLGGGLFA
ncbi:ferrous iron transporter B [Planococcaceae bacterium Storch 2/2-2]|nr:ferrous iron transporter B [Planococcaceae bacterium Storch 2/2-2]